MATSTNTSGRRFIGYIRISVDRADETSTTTQHERMSAWCVAHGHQLVDVVIEAGRSAFKQSRTSRPGYRQVEQRLRAGAGDGLLVWKIDRACRNTEDTLALVRGLDERDMAFASVTEPFDTTTAAGRMMLTVLAALAEMESATKSERVQVWQDRRRATGATPTGPRPFGYQRERNELIIDDAEAFVIKRCAQAVLDGTGKLRSLAAQLAAEGHLTGRGTPLTSRGLRKVLTSPTIAAMREVEPGVFVPSDQWEPILPADQWREVRAILLDPARRTNPCLARRWILAGVARCSVCNVPMRAKPHVSGTRYSCPTCHRSIEAERTDELIEKSVLELLDPATWRALRAGRPVGGNGETEFAEQMAALSSRFVAGEIDAVELGELADGLRRARDAAAAEAPRLPDVDDVRAAWGGLDVEARRLVVMAATETLTIHPARPGLNGYDTGRVSWRPVE